MDGETFDSKVEYRYYLKLKQEHQTFNVHESFEIVSPFHIGRKKYRKRVYTPDFVVRDNNGIRKVIDVKGAKVTEASSLRMDLFSYEYSCPVTIARYDYRNKYFKEHTKR